MSLFPQPFSGYQRISSSGVIGGSGKPIIVYGYSILSGSGGVAKPAFYDGTSTSGTLVFNADPSNGAISTERTIPLAVGVMFSTGCFVNFDGNTSQVTVFYTQAN